MAARKTTKAAASKKGATTKRAARGKAKGTSRDSKLIEPKTTMGASLRKKDHFDLTDDGRDEILDRLENGEFLYNICDELGIKQRTLHAIRERDQEFDRQVRQAIEDGETRRIGETINLADRACDRDTAAAAKVQVDARFKLAQFKAPRLYGAHADLRDPRDLDKPPSLSPVVVIPAKAEPVDPDEDLPPDDE